MFDEWVETYGLESAKAFFGTSDHLVLTVRPGYYVTGVCGKWHGSEPLGDTTRNPNIETACQRIRNILRGAFETEEIVYDDAASMF